MKPKNENKQHGWQIRHAKNKRTRVYLSPSGYWVIQFATCNLKEPVREYAKKVVHSEKKRWLRVVYTTLRISPEAMVALGHLVRTYVKTETTHS